MAIYYGIKNPNYSTLRYDINTGQVEIYETREATEEETSRIPGEVVEVFVTAKDLSLALAKIRDRLKSRALDEWSLQTLEQIAIEALDFSQ